MTRPETSAVVPGFNPWVVACVVSLATFMEVLDTTITNVSLSHIAGSLGASQDESTWVLTSYLVANGIVLPLSGWLADVMGRKRFFMLCIGAFTVASLFCGVATSLGMLVVFRLIQGLAGGGLQPTQQSIIIDSFPKEKRGAVFGITGITMIVAPILGPTLGGLITDNMSWRWIFYLNVPVGLLAFWLVGLMVQDPPHAKAKGLVSIDYIGLSLIAVGLGAMQMVLDKGQQDDWFDSGFICGMAALSIACLVTAVAWLWRQEDPVIDLKLLRLPSFGMACMMIFFMGFSLYASSTLLPLLTQSEFGYDATTAGMVLSPGGFAVIFIMPIAGKLINKVEARFLVSFGMFCLTLGMLRTMLVTPQASYPDFVTMRVMQVMGLPFLFIPISTLAFLQIPKEKSGKASALYALGRNLGGSFGIAIIDSYVVRHQQIHQSALSAHLSGANAVYQGVHAGYLQAIFSHGRSLAAATQSAGGRLYFELGRQSTILGYHDAFVVIASITALLSLVALLMPRNDPHMKAQAGGGH
jgi:DHA2 family multidrug resistance protein